jgi:thiamine biosynthesis protein ThiS
MKTDTSQISVNGSPFDIGSIATVADLLQKLGMKPELVAVELNRELVRRMNFASTSVSPGDQIEIVEFVGGG